jgi:Transglutaminase-like superfamily
MDGQTTEISRLPTLPFEDQLALIDREVSRQSGAVCELLRTAAALRDHEPLAYTVRRLARARLLARPAVREALAQVVLELPATGVQRLLRRLEDHELPDDQLAVISACMIEAVQRHPIERLVVVCVIDRWLKNHCPGERAALISDAVERARSALERGAPEALDDALLLSIPSAPQEELRRMASQLGHSDAWRARRGRFAERVIEVLEAQPKSLSQANAEELLSRRVYTDPGHFFFELMQNAEDAGARRWDVTIDDRRVTVWHDGEAFDAKDVVGVLSIGQTTKRKDQIGFFGVGFKSVYEVCERPQIYSQVFRFEIADVSIPRRLQGPPAELPQDGTLLVLPLRDPADPLRSPQLLYEYALAVPPQTLLTLRSLRRIQIRHGEASRTVEEDRSTPGLVQLRHLEQGTEDAYLVEEEVYRYAGPRARVSSTPVLVAVALDEAGLPRPLAAESPTLFSYLPTGERTGLRFLLHAHFVLPVDRERLDLEAPYNRWALSHGGELLARLARRLGEGDVPRAPGSTAAPGRRAALEALLRVFPLVRELADPAYALIVERLRAELEAVALLPGAAGETLTPQQASVADDPSLIDVLAGVVLDGSDRRLLAPLSPRSSEVALTLGAARFGVAELVSLLERTLRDLPDGSPPPATWVKVGSGIILETLGNAPAGPLERVASLPLLPGPGGRLYRPGALARAEGELRSLYEPVRPLVDHALDLEPRPGQERLMRRLGLKTLSCAELLSDLADPALASRLLRSEGSKAERVSAARLLLSLLTRQPREQLAGLGARCIFLDHRHGLGPLTAGLDASPAPVYLAPPGPLGELLGGLTSRGSGGLSLVHSALSGSYEGLLRDLGAQVLDLPTLLDLLETQQLGLTDDALWELHAVLDRMYSDLSPRLLSRLNGVPIFLDHQGRRRSLTGAAAALLPADASIGGLAPAAPWLHPRLAALKYIWQLGTAPVGPRAVVQTLLFQRDDLFDPLEQTGLRRAQAYLAAHHEGLTPRELAALAGAPTWLDRAGERRSLDELRCAPEDLLLSALYDCWGAFPMIETRVEASPAEERWISSLETAQALGLQRRLMIPDHQLLVEDLLARPPAELSAELRGLLVRVIAGALQQLPRSTLDRLRQVPMFRDASGRLRPLSRWDEAQGAGCCRAAGVIREALSHGSRPLLGEEDDRDFEPLCRALGVTAATPADLVAALEQDPLLREPSACDAARRALVQHRDELTAAAGASRSARLSALAIWPSTDGLLLPARQLLLGADLLHVLGEGWQELLQAGRKLTVLAAGEEEEAQALAGLLSFQDPITVVLGRIAEEARAGEPLGDQPVFMNTVQRLLRLLRAVVLHPELGAQASTLPLSLDAAGRLAQGPLCGAGDDARALLRGLPLFDKLADPAWWSEARRLDESLTPTLTPRRVLGALADACREPLETRRCTAPPGLDQPDQRRRLYRWILAHQDEIAADDQSLGLLGRACVVASVGGVLRAPRELLLQPDLPELGIDWNAAGEVPPELSRWFERVFQLEEHNLHRLLEYLLQAHDEAVARSDGGRSFELLRFLVRSLRAAGGDLGGAVERLPRRFKLRRRLRVEAADGSFRRPRSLTAIPPQHRELIERFCLAPPLRVADRYTEDPRVHELLLVAGASGQLPAEQLRQLLAGDGGICGEEASLALARYVALLTEETPSLRQELHLQTSSWIPNVVGQRRAPRDLYWPDAATEALIGARPELFPHPEFFHSVPAPLLQWLPFRTADSISLTDVADRLRTNPPAPLEVLEWIDRGIHERRLKPGLVREALEQIPLIVDDDGFLRLPTDVFLDISLDLFGPRRGTWSEGRDFPRLAGALRIANHPGVKQVLAYMDELARELDERGGGALMKHEPALALHLPRGLALLGGHRRQFAASRILVAAVNVEQEATICRVSDPRLVLAQLEDVDPVPGPESKLLFPILPEEGEASLERLLRRCGVREPGVREPGARVQDASVELEDAPGARPGSPRRGEQGERGEAPGPELAEAETQREAEAQREAEGGGLLSRIRRWLNAEPADDERPDTGDEPGKEDEDPEPKEEPERGSGRRGPVPSPPAGRRSSPRRRRRKKKPRQPRTGERSALWDDAGSEPEGEVDHSRWFRPRANVGPQLDDADQWLADRQRRPRFGFAFAPRQLPAPYLYAPHLVAHQYDARRQRWLPVRSPAQWGQAAGEGDYLVTLQGRVPAGEVVLPIPTYGRVVAIDCGDAGRRLTTQEGQQLLLTRAEIDLRYTVALDPVPSFGGLAPGQLGDVDHHLLELTVADDELPAEVLDFLHQLQGEADALTLAIEVREFIKENYRYDGSYLEDPALAHWLHGITRGRSNSHIAALHAGRDARHLGRGVCYELNTLACELLRRLEIPSAVTVGWTLDRGHLADPDHLWATALLPTEHGPRWYPLDASTTRAGRPIHAAARPAGPWRVKSPKRGGQPPVVDGIEPSPRRERARPQPRRSRAPTFDLLRVARYLEAFTGRSLGGKDRLRQLCQEILEDEAAAHDLLLLIGKDNDPPGEVDE